MDLHEVKFRAKNLPSSSPELAVQYGHKMDHRDRTMGKAQWRILYPDERDIFRTAMINQWIERKFAWSLYCPDGVVSNLGVDRDHKTELFIAKFDEHAAPAWHGYPCNYKMPQQRPPEAVLRDWLDQNFLPPAKVRKIASGQRCVI